MPRLGCAALAGADWIRGAGRNTGGMHAGIRTEGQTAVIATIAAAIAGVFAYKMVATAF